MPNKKAADYGGYTNWATEYVVVLIDNDARYSNLANSMARTGLKKRDGGVFNFDKFVSWFSRTFHRLEKQIMEEYESSASEARNSRGKYERESLEGTQEDYSPGDKLVGLFYDIGGTSTWEEPYEPVNWKEVALEYLSREEQEEARTKKDESIDPFSEKDKEELKTMGISASKVSFTIKGKEKTQVFSTKESAAKFIKEASAKFGDKFKVIAAPMPPRQQEPVTSGMSDIGAGAPSFKEARWSNEMTIEEEHEKLSEPVNLCSCKACEAKVKNPKKKDKKESSKGTARVSSLTPEKIKDKDIPEAIEVAKLCFPEFTDIVEEVVREALNNDFSHSYVVKDNGRIIGGYFLGQNQLPSDVKGAADYADKRGIEGVALFVLPEYRGKGIGHTLRDIPLHSGMDYIWGQHYDELNNLEPWKAFGRKHMDTIDGVHITLMDLKPTSKNEKEFSKEAGSFNLSPSGVPSQVIQEFYPELQHELVSYPNVTNAPMTNPDISGDIHSTPEYNEGDLPGSIEDVFSTMSRIGYISTSPAPAMGLGIEAQPQVLEGAPLRKDNLIRGPQFIDEFYQNFEGIDGATLTLASKTAGMEDKEQFSLFLKRVMGEVAASFIAAYKVTSRLPLNKVPGVGEIQLALVEQPIQNVFNVVNSGSRVKALIDKLTDSEQEDAINEAWAQAAVWNDSKDGGFILEVFVRAETLDQDSMILKYRYVLGTKEAD